MHCKRAELLKCVVWGTILGELMSGGCCFGKRRLNVMSTGYHCTQQVKRYRSDT